MKYRLHVDEDGFLHVTVEAKKNGRRFTSAIEKTDTAHDRIRIRELLSERVGNAVQRVHAAQGLISVPEAAS